MRTVRRICCYILVSTGLLFWSQAGQGNLAKNRQFLPKPPPSVGTLKKAKVSPIFYSNVEIRHQLNAYIEKSPGQNSHEDPSVQVRAQLGSVLYQGVIDLYLNLSAEKLPKNLAVYQRRPEMYANVYILRSKFFKIRQYNVWRLPFTSSRKMLEKYESRWDEELDREGTVYIVGLNPSFNLEFASSMARWEAYLATDLSSRLYSRTQYATFSDKRSGELGTIEDHVPRLGSVQALGGYLSPNALPKLKIGGSIHFRSYFLPYYFQTNDLGVQNRYLADRASYYKLRLQFQLNDRLTLINDFMHFHQGFFASKRRGKEKRYKNIFRVSFVL
ncbi:MAG: hypothetical protein HRU09_13980 [Oligoflexales bacterium]|nr:hypothetical protein [Oligoflexales bacterium]